MKADEIVVGARIRPLPGGPPASLEVDIIGVDGTDVWVRPTETDKDRRSFILQAEALTEQWETFAPIDGRNLLSVHRAGGCDCEDGGHDGYVRIDCAPHPVDFSPTLALNMAAWILQVLKPGREWGDIQRAVALVAEASDA